MLIKTLKLAERLRTGSQTVLPLLAELGTHVPPPLSVSESVSGAEAGWFRAGASLVQFK